MIAMTTSLRTPTRPIFQSDAVRIVARAENGLFGVLPAHVDFVATLAPGVLCVFKANDEEILFGHDEGVFVKHGSVVDICVRRAVAGTDLAQLQDAVRQSFFEVDEAERTERAALARLEAGVIRRFARLGSAR